MQAAVKQAIAQVQRPARRAAVSHTGPAAIARVAGMRDAGNAAQQCWRLKAACTCLQQAICHALHQARHGWILTMDQREHEVCVAVAGRLRQVGGRYLKQEQLCAQGAVGNSSCRSTQAGRQ